MTVLLNSAVMYFPLVSWIVAGVFIVMVPIIIVGNVLVLASILLDPFKNIRSAPSSYIIFNLALADLLVGVFPLPLMSHFYIYFLTNNSKPFPSSVISFVTALAVGVSLDSLLTLSADRLLAIKTPLKYNIQVTKKRITRLNIFIWFHLLLLGILPLINQLRPLFAFISFCYMLVASVALTLLNISLIYLVRNRGRNIRNFFESENLAVLQNTFNREKVVTRVAVIVTVAFEVCFLPVLILQTLSSLVTKMADFSLKTPLYLLTIVLIYSNSLMNPFLYAWRLPKYRKAFRYIFNKIKNKIPVFSLLRSELAPSDDGARCHGKQNNRSTFQADGASYLHNFENNNNATNHTGLDNVNDMKTIQNTKF